MISAVTLSAQIPLYILNIQEGSGVISLAPSPEGPWRVAQNGEWVWHGDYLRAEEGAEAVLLSGSKNQNNGESVSFQTHGNPRMIRDAAGRIDIDVKSVYGGRPGGRTRGGEFSLYTPANASRILLKEPMVLRWEPTKPGSKVAVIVEDAGKKRIWKGQFDGALGKASAPDLLSAMKTSSKSGNRRFNIVCFEIGSGKKQIMMNRCELLSPAKTKELEAKLAKIANPESPFYHVLRASLYAEYRLYGLAVEEVELAKKSKPQFKNSSHFKEFRQAVWELVGKV